MKKKAQKKGSKKPRISKYAEPGSVVNTSSPAATSIVAQIAPFRVPRGVASVLADALPSQKLSARGLLSISVSSGSSLLFNAQPCIFNDSTRTSAFGFTCPSANLSDATSCITSATAAVHPANCIVYTALTNTPYSLATMQGNDYKFRLVSNGTRFRCTTPVVNRGGVLKYIVDETESIIKYSEAGSLPFSSIISAINASHRTIRVSLAERTEVDISAPNTSSQWAAIADGTQDAFGWFGSGLANIRVGGTSATAVGGVGPTWVLYENTSGQTQSFDIELIEHWEVHSPSIEPLHTASVSMHAAHQLTTALVSHAHSQHSSQPHLSFAQVVKGVAKMEHNKAAMQDVSALAPALALLA